MPTGGDLEVSAEEANEAFVVAPTMGDPGGDLHPRPPLEKLWHCSKVEKGPTVPKKGKTDGWRCRHCGKEYYPVSAPRATYHCAQEDGGSIVICPKAAAGTVGEFFFSFDCCVFFICMTHKSLPRDADTRWNKVRPRTHIF